MHVKAGTTGGERSPRLDWHFHRGMFRFYRKHYAPQRSPLVNLAVYARDRGEARRLDLLSRSLRRSLARRRQRRRTAGRQRGRVGKHLGRRIGLGGSCVAKPVDPSSQTGPRLRSTTA